MLPNETHVRTLTTLQRPLKSSCNAFSLAFAHANGLVLVDLIQKSLILNASLRDLYGGTSPLSCASLASSGSSQAPPIPGYRQEHHGVAAVSVSHQQWPIPGSAASTNATMSQQFNCSLDQRVSFNQFCIPFQKRLSLQS